MIRRRRREVVRDGETADEALDRLIMERVQEEERASRRARSEDLEDRRGIRRVTGMFFPLPGWGRIWPKMDAAGKELYGVPLDKENNPANTNGFWNGQVNQFKIGVGVNSILVGLEGVGLEKDLGQVGYLRKSEDVLECTAGTML